MAGKQIRGGGSWPILAAGLAGGVGEVGGKLEGLEGYLPVVAVGVGMAGGGRAVGSGGRRWWQAAAHRRPWAAVAGLRRISGGR